MPALYTSLELTDGTTSCNLVDLINYALVEGGWSPALPALNESPLGPVFPAVIEELAIDVKGSTATIALANLAKLQTLLIQARRWARGEDVPPVVFKVQMQGSNLAAPAQSLVYGLPGAAPIVPPSSYSDLLFGGNADIEAVTVRFQRQGAFYDALETMSVASAPAANGTVQSMTFPSSVSLPAPMSVTIGGFAAGGGIPTTGGLLIVSNSINHFKIVDSAGLSGDVLVTSTINETGTLPHGGSILRYTTPTSQPHTLSLGDNGSSLSGMTASHVAIYGVFRNNSATSTFGVQPATAAGTGREALIEPGNQQPQIVPLGVIAGTQAHTRLSLKIRNYSGVAGATLDLDRIVVVGLDPPTQIVQIQPTSIASYQLASSLVVEDRMLTARKPAVRQLFSDNSSLYLGYTGALPLYSLGNTVVTCLVGTSGIYWRLPTAAGLIQNITLQATRYPVLLTPQ